MLCLSLLTLPTGCKEGPQAPITIFSASSTTDALLEIKSAFKLAHPNINIEIISAGSQTLAMQISEGADADIFISADRAQIIRVPGYAPPEILVQNQLVAISHTLNSDSVTQAVNDASTIIIAHKHVPAGRYTLDALVAIDLWENAEPKIVSHEPSVRSVLTKVTLKQADLGFVYRTDTINTTAKINVIEFPSNAPTTTQTWITRRAMTTSDQSPTNLVYQFITQSDEAMLIFERTGFTIVEGSP